MDLKEFVNSLFKLYPNSWNESNEFLKKRQYLVALDNPKVDFELLMDRIAKYHNSEFMPTTAWLREQANHCYHKVFKNATSQWQQVEVMSPNGAIRKSDCFPAGTSIGEMINAYKKKFNTDGWQILEIY